MKMRAFAVQINPDRYLDLEKQVEEFLTCQPPVQVRFVVSVGDCLTVWYEEVGSLSYEFLNESLNKLSLTIRAFVTLSQPRCAGFAPISSIKQLTEKSASELLKYKGFGKKSLADVRRQLAFHDLHLRDEPIAKIDQ